MKYISPSYQRADSVKTHLLLPDVVYAVHEFESADYAKAGHEVLELPDSLRGNIPNVRNWIIGNSTDSDLIFIDDDIEAFTYWQAQKQNHLSGETLVEHIEQMADLAKSWGVVLFGVNPAIDKGSYREHTPFSTSSYISCSFHGLLNCRYRYDPKLPLKEDYDLCIQICNAERKILRFNQYGLRKKDHGNRGGCASYRTIEREKDQFKLLQKKWGKAIVKMDGGESHVRRTKDKGYDVNPIVRIPIAGV